MLWRETHTHTQTHTLLLWSSLPSRVALADAPFVSEETNSGVITASNVAPAVCLSHGIAQTKHQVCVCVCVSICVLAGRPPGRKAQEGCEACDVNGTTPDHCRVFGVKSHIPVTVRRKHDSPCEEETDREEGKTHEKEEDMSGKSWGTDREDSTDSHSRGSCCSLYQAVSESH